jgi:hypothetical protein
MPSKSMHSHVTNSLDILSSRLAVNITYPKLDAARNQTALPVLFLSIESDSLRTVVLATSLIVGTCREDAYELAAKGNPGTY